MGEVFDLLREDFADSRSWPLFVMSAEAAQMNFGEYRRLEKQAKKIGEKISSTAKGLAALVRELRETGMGLPGELMPPYKEGSVISIDGSSPEVRRLKLLRALRSQRSKQIDKDQSGLDIRVVLLQLSDATRDLQPDFMSAAIRSAMSTRQNSRKTSYIRAFAAHLEESHIAITSAVKRAMAITGNVIFNDTNMNISEDDVRKALARQHQQTRSSKVKGPRRQARKSRAPKTR
jgi:hypothetical protein